MDKVEKKKIIVSLIVILLISLVLEAVVFNINSFRLLGGNYKYKKINISNEMLNGLENIGENKYKATKNQPTIYINDINMATGTIKIDVKRQDYESKINKRKINVIIYFTDATSKYFRPTPEKTINALEERSQFGILHFSGNTKALTIDLQVAKDEVIQLNPIELNVNVPYKFNITRFITVFLIIETIYLLFNLKIFEQKYDKKNKYHSTAICCVLAVFLFVLINISSLSNYNKNLISHIPSTRTIVYEKYYTDSLMNGSLSLQVEKDNKLDEMENTYDTTARDRENIDYLYDYAYYNGKYYVYFTILPQLLLNIPFKLITGKYLNVAYEILLFAILGAMFTMLAVEKLIKKYFENVSLRMMVISMTTALFSSVLLYLVGRPLVYEVAGTCGYWLTMQAMFFFACAFDKEKINYKCLTLGCISAALAVNARPNLLLVSFLVLPTFIEKFTEFIKKIKQDKEKTIMKEFIKYLLCIILPYGIIGISMMILNYIRFGSITEFGASYQLTSNDMINLGYRYSTIPIGIWHYLFNPPVLDLTFPFIHMKPVMPLYIGFYGHGYVGVGTFFATPICCILLFIPVLRKYIKNKNIHLWRLIKRSLIIAIIMIITITLLAASYERYSLDYTWMIVWPSLAIMLIVHEIVNKNDIIKKMFERICMVTTIICICTSMAMALKSESNYAEYVSTKKYDDIAESMMFWE